MLRHTCLFCSFSFSFICCCCRSSFRGEQDKTVLVPVSGTCVLLCSWLLVVACGTAWALSESGAPPKSCSFRSRDSGSSRQFGLLLLCARLTSGVPGVLGVALLDVPQSHLVPGRVGLVLRHGKGGPSERVLSGKRKGFGKSSGIASPKVRAWSRVARGMSRGCLRGRSGKLTHLGTANCCLYRR